MSARQSVKIILIHYRGTSSENIFESLLSYYRTVPVNSDMPLLLW
jgi:hypothetical protein